MSDLTADFLQAVQAHQQQAPPTGALAGARVQALRDVELPGRRDEAWRFSSVRRFLGDVPPQPLLGAVELDGSAVALADAPAEALAHLGRVARAHGFQAVNFGLFASGAVVHARDGEALAPATVRLLGTAGVTTPRVLIVAGAGSSVEVWLEHALDRGLHLPVVEVVAGAGARVSLTHVVGGTGHAVAHVAVDKGEDAQVTFRSLVLGGEQVRVELTAGGGERSVIDTGGLVLARGSQHVDHHLELQHDAHRITSRQVFRNVLDGRARAVFTGAVTVCDGVHGSDAQQSANTLLLADGASAVARPWLEIHDDDVVASHGATVGKLDDESLFYLRARGIAVDDARRLLTRAFALQALDGIPERFHADALARVDAWLDA